MFASDASSQYSCDKTYLSDLAIVTGQPAFPEPLHVGRPNQGDSTAFLERIVGMLECNWLTNDGPLVREFEQRVAEIAQVKHCIAMANGTVGLEIAIRAAGLTGEVIVPSYTFVATAHALQWQGLTPVFCDIDAATHTVDAKQLESLITPRTSGIIGVHLWGKACNIEALTEISNRRGLSLLFDAAHAFGCSYRGRRIGGFGLAEVFSFHATKFVHCGEGGAVVTNDDTLAEKMRLMRNFGFAGHDNVIHVGTNGKMGEAAAAMGLTSLESMQSFVTANQRNYATYKKCMALFPGIRLLDYDEVDETNHQYVVAEVDPIQCSLTRDQLLAVLVEENVLRDGTSILAAIGLEPYRSLYPQAYLWLPQTECTAERTLVLPTGSSVDSTTVHRICDIIACGELEHAEDVARLLSIRAGGTKRSIKTLIDQEEH